MIAVRGDLDVYSAPRLRERLLERVSQGQRNIIVDLDTADFIDSAGLGVLVAGLKRLRSHDGELSLVCTRRNHLKLLEITGLTLIFPTASTVGRADRQIAAKPVPAALHRQTPTGSPDTVRRLLPMIETAHTAGGVRLVPRL